MSDMHTDIAALLKQRQNQFIETRTIIESEVNKFVESLYSQDEMIRQQLQVPDGLSAKTLLPSLWEEPFNETKYKGELSALKQYIAGCKAYADKLAKEALECLQM